MNESPAFPPVDGIGRRMDSIPPEQPAGVSASPVKVGVRIKALATHATRTVTSREAKGRVDTAPVTLSLPTALAEATTTFAKKNSVSYPDLVMDAIVASHDELHELIAKANSTAESDGLFVRTQRQTAGPRSTRSFRMRRDNLEVIDQLAKKVAAESRSQLCRVALEKFLKSSSK